MKKVFFYGIGGASMSALASITAKHCLIWGYDDNKSAKCPKWENIEISPTLNYEIIKNCDYVVYTCAIKDIAPLSNFCKQNNIPLLERAEYLAKFSQE